MQSLPHRGPPNEVRVRSYRDLLAGYRVHLEEKFLGPDGRPCRRQTVGLLQQRAVHARPATHIGKEANRLEDVQQGLVADLGEVLNEYESSTRDPLRTEVLPALAHLSPTAASKIRFGKLVPHVRHWEALSELWQFE